MVTQCGLAPCGAKTQPSEWTWAACSLNQMSPPIRLWTLSLCDYQIVSEDVFSEGGSLAPVPHPDVKWDSLDVKPLLSCVFLSCPVPGSSPGIL